MSGFGGSPLKPKAECLLSLVHPCIHIPVKPKITGFEKLNSIPGVIQIKSESIILLLWKISKDELLYLVAKTGWIFRFSIALKISITSLSSLFIDGKILSRNEILFERYYQGRFNEKQWLKQAKIKG